MKHVDFTPSSPRVQAAYKEAKAFVALMKAEGAGADIMDNNAIVERLEILLAFYIDSKKGGTK